MIDLNWLIIYKKILKMAPGFAEEMDYELIAIPTIVELIKMSRQIPDATPEERRKFGRSRLIYLVTDRASGETLYLAGAASLTAHLCHTDRAQRHARFLTEATGIPAVPVIISLRNTPEVESLIESGAVRWIQLDEHNIFLDEHDIFLE